MLGTMPNLGTIPSCVLSACLGTVLLSHIAAQQVDAKNWGKNSPGITLQLREGPRERRFKARFSCTTFSVEGSHPAFLTTCGNGRPAKTLRGLCRESVLTNVA
jgi:hypothetical protein